ncbi:tRNA modification GTPase MnmE [Planktothrix agardhii]|jgi:predicted GTPase|uniref:GTPase family protein n=1 Tax=Planktothrix agardhii TaxID=1160 RepID=UPI001A29FD02|nr:GTPase [Planktothrix agardhii]MBG0747329.1 50S ribosome-binding GTPase [Planktothrix agardhii KL2]MCB8749928.1 50S ribosome-binding GTPase [Planktothrix agardhii 1810]MCB8758677.1 50S ribosome-binding GTPase [Planktothrix agardhii 1813]CAD5936862.1 tRNA modification GTPase MnmE [Planktothrix agardhii]CAD5956027.1 tRNA modification GTPase MnmE [Planktothrix agardhii]
MIRLKLWQWMVLITPMAMIVIFLLTAAGVTIHNWGINWIWAVFTLIFVGWRWLLVRWTKPMLKEMETITAKFNQELELSLDQSRLEPATNPNITQVEIALQEILKAAQNDPLIWEESSIFWKRCQDVVTTVANIYHPEVKYPLLSIYIPQAYQLIRGTMDDLDQLIQKLSPALNQVTVGQAYQTYQVYQKLEPSARKLLKVWNWAQWLLNPVSALARVSTQKTTNQATQQLLGNLGQSLREVALRNLCCQAIALYGGDTLPVTEFSVNNLSFPQAKTQTIRDILTTTEPVKTLEQKPVNLLLVGRTGAGKSSLINTLFKMDQAVVDVLPSTEQIQNYQWQTDIGESLNLWDTPGYEQVHHPELREQVLDYATNADLLLLITPALDPALQIDVDFLREIKQQELELPIITIVTQVDRLRPIREWQPPYDWQWGNRPKEKSIREATEYRLEQLGEYCDRVLPIVTQDSQTQRQPWGVDRLSIAILETINPAKQIRLARFLQNQEAQILATAKIIDHYTFQMATTQGLAALLKSPILSFISTLATGSPTLALLLAEKIPVEQLPVVIGKLQMAYDLFLLLNSGESDSMNFDLLVLWPLLLENHNPSEKNPWAFGHALVEYWTQKLTIEQMQQRFQFYLNQGKV